MKQLTELDRYILKQEFPQLSLTEDPDIERYFEFRAQNRQADALKLYNAKLIRRYPDNRIRVLLMTYYRKRDARFHLLLADSLARLADTTITQVKRIIVFFAGTVAPLKNAKVYSIIQVCEKVIGAISSDRFAVISFTEKYVRYAEKLRYHAADMRQAADMLRMYITDTISSVREFREEQVRNARERNRKAVQYGQVSVIDFSKITFTRQQIAAITIASSIYRTEDKVLAYTIKYWNRYDDGAFENTVLLYSRKYGTNHYAVFQAVKIARIRKWKDDELLHAVLANVAQGYYYNISGDLYLQRTWKQLKLKLGPETPQEDTAALPKKTAQPKEAKRQPLKSRAEKAPKTLKDKKTQGAAGKKRGSRTMHTEVSISEVSAQPTKKRLHLKSEDKIVPVRVTRKTDKAAAAVPLKSEGTLQLDQTAPKVKKDEPAQPYSPPNTRTAAASTAVKSDIPVTPVQAASGVRRKTRASPVQKTADKVSQESLEKQVLPVQIYPLTAPKERPLSIADTIKKVTGKNYGVYHDLFFKNVRASIRAILQYSAIHKLSFFGSEQNNAENIIYQFLETHYDNPYQQWQGSEEQADVLKEGFRIDSLEPIIRHWAQHNV